MIQQEGNGWRIAWDPSRVEFPVLVGGEFWAFELTDAEWKSLVKLVLDLLDEHQKLKSQLMDQESLTLEIEREFCWASLEGDKDKWSLQVILDSEGDHCRGVEAYWPNSIAKDFTHGLRIVWEAYQ